jgi:hypothetical protein
MTDDRDTLDTRALLARELGKLAGAEAGRWSEAGENLGLEELGVVIEPSVVRDGTERGARLGARFTKVDHVDLELDLAEAPAAVFRRACDLLRELGSLRDLGGNRAQPSVAAVLRSGFGNMNPALVTVAVAPAGSGTRVRIDGFALEGLIKQRAAGKAARRIAELLAG